MSLDISKLKDTKKLADRTTAQCPACAKQGGDKKGEHLVIWPNGSYGCVAHPNDKMHRKEIYRLVGISDEDDPDRPVPTPIRRPACVTRTQKTILVLTELATLARLPVVPDENQHQFPKPPEAELVTEPCQIGREVEVSEGGEGAQDIAQTPEGERHHLLRGWLPCIINPGKLIVYLKDGPGVQERIQYLKSGYEREGSAFLVKDMQRQLKQN